MDMQKNIHRRHRPSMDPEVQAAPNPAGE